MRVLVWHVHGGWMDAFIRGRHTYVVPVTDDDRSPPGPAGRPWPPNVELTRPSDLPGADVDVVVLQRLEELDLVEQLLGRRPGRDLPAVFVEHNTPRADVPSSLHPLRDRDDLTIAHVTHWNALMWDCGTTRTRVVEHGIVDPGPRWTGRLERFGVVVNEPVRRARVAGSDLVPRFAAVAPVDHFGMRGDGLRDLTGLGEDRLGLLGDVPTSRMHTALAARRAYLHLNRWTSLGLALLEAMHLAMPVVVLAATEAPRAVPPEAGAVSTDLDELVAAAARLLADPEEAARRGQVARQAALARYALPRYLTDWDALLDEVAVPRSSPSPTATPERTSA